MPVIIKTTVLLLLANVFMTFAWYAHLKDMNNKAWYIAAIASWSIASKYRIHAAGPGKPDRLLRNDPASA